MAATDLLADPAELAVWLGVPADDPKLLAALTAASRRFRGAVRHPVTFVSADSTTLDGNGRDSLLLPAAPVTAITSVTVCGTALVAGTDYTWSADGYLRRLGRQVWPDLPRSVVIVWDHGHTLVPDDIQEAVIDQARSLFQVQPGIQSYTAGSETVMFGAQASVGVTAQWSAAVEAHRLRQGDEA